MIEWACDKVAFETLQITLTSRAKDGWSIFTVTQDGRVYTIISWRSPDAAAPSTITKSLAGPTPR